MSVINSLKALANNYENNKSEFTKKVYKQKIKKFKDLFEIEVETFMNKCLEQLNIIQPNGWEVSVKLVKSYDNAIGFSSNPVGEYRYENIYNISFINKHLVSNKTVTVPLLSFRTFAKSKFDYLNNPFPSTTKINLLTLYFNEKKLEKLHFSFTPNKNDMLEPLTDIIRKCVWSVAETKWRNLIVNYYIPKELEKLCSLYENKASAEEIENCKNKILYYNNELKTYNNETIK